eukprot:CAMPEP_0174360048 /NCGR_PEP_ID=MMETSP0811_2-20130205/51917_1 /TAXON_ID=73025 ORGANISM="Eutreptiella gymnastica-like, Strain CCMP1594" /NCGR_SAMPLE_ID=MMETSP0811_2 /ASSEMBLY_ACC=CAM_ASM_000667 /LENGTH=35 /DNA_ID= /DNA_START= /DNA_END= /DNA_ORIENTATION=
MAGQWPPSEPGNVFLKMNAETGKLRNSMRDAEASL